MKSPISKLKGGLIVSCQAARGSPVFGARWMAGFARAAELGGAVGTRVNSPPDIHSVRLATRLPIIGIHKTYSARYPVFITPNFAVARAVVGAGADIVALDGTRRARRSGISLGTLIARIHHELKVPVLADIDSVDEAVAAVDHGADMVATTLAGFTDARPATVGPDLDLVAALVARIAVPVICEGRVQHPDHVREAFAAGAYAVVVGTAITDPVAITARFAEAAPRSVAKRQR